MAAQLISFAAGLVAFIAYTMIFLVLMRFRFGMDWFGLQVASGGIIHILSSILFSVILDKFLYWYALGIYTVCWFSFLTLSTAIYASISARILRTIDQQPARVMPLEKIFLSCVRKPFEERAELLVKSGLAQKGELGYRITSEGRKYAQQLLFLRQVLGMESAGLYSSVKDTIEVEENEIF